MIPSKVAYSNQSVQWRDLARNEILADLPREEVRSLLPRLEFCYLQANEVLANSGRPISYCYFLLDSVVTLLSSFKEGQMVGVGIIGNEGMVGIRTILGRKAGSCLVLVHIPGTCLRIESDLLRGEFKRGGVLQERLLQYIGSIYSQVCQSTGCNRTHQLEQRLCRWLLNFQDRLKSNELGITHESFSELLGAPRSDVTRTIAVLREMNALESSRGKVSILNRKLLESRCCECYSIVQNDRASEVSVGW